MQKTEDYNGKFPIRYLLLMFFLLLQVLDGGFTYTGVSIMGLQTEGNPLIVWLISTLGLGCGLLFAKSVAVLLGVSALPGQRGQTDPVSVSLVPRGDGHPLAAGAITSEMRLAK